MKTSRHGRWIEVQGPAHDPHVRHPDGSTRQLPFFCDFAPETRVLDVGCGSGLHLRELTTKGCRAVGVERNAEAVQALQRQGLSVVTGCAERLPFPDGSFDAVICSVVVPYTDERQCVLEWARVLAPQGQVRASYHGLGYPLKHLLCGPGWKLRIYGARTIVNSWVYRTTGRRMPSFWGDTLYQSSACLQRYYGDAGLRLISEYVRPALRSVRDVFFHHLTKAR